ncbi:MAG: hypothetical protein K0R62_5881 [Nonomuraea muscovyensis]|uniref:Uncharacterized protein n=1 Tax=Nonomuraea muscovyensis TaxID=1124761 RepID=A0A7X0EXW3_9ACTN|nr:hypothetical protein [Nonomuraea muscovyensis]MDF2710229.1 hypothetical protein [Nonomuraea muscovyensis]
MFHELAVLVVTDRILPIDSTGRRLPGLLGNVRLVEITCRGPTGSPSRKRGSVTVPRLTVTRLKLR